MKRIARSLFIGTTGLTIALTMGTRPANALTFMFSQSGWENDGEVSGMFSGEDKDGNGQIIFDPNDDMKNEVSSYRMSFSGNSIIPDFEHNLTHLNRLTYTLGSTNMADILSIEGDFNYDGTFLKSIQQIGPDQSVSTNEEVLVQQVPEPTSWVGLVVLGLGVSLRRTITSKSLN
ncbi:MAG: PEP-CTERM sorting domain-containing protein [Crocosphaera sp.]